MTERDVQALEAVLTETNDVQSQMRIVSTYLYALVTTDSRDDQAAANMVELQTRSAAIGPLDEAPRRVARSPRCRGVHHAQHRCRRARVRAPEGGRRRRVADDRGGGIARRRARTFGFPGLAAAARRRVVAADRRGHGRRRDRARADGDGARPRDPSRRGAPPGRVRRRARRVGDGGGTACGRAQRRQGRARACSTDGEVSSTISSRTCVRTTSTVRPSMR